MRSILLTLEPNWPTRVWMFYFQRQTRIFIFAALQKWRLSKLGGCLTPWKSFALLSFWNSLLMSMALRNPRPLKWKLREEGNIGTTHGPVQIPHLSNRLIRRLTSLQHSAPQTPETFTDDTKYLPPDSVSFTENGSTPLVLTVFRTHTVHSAPQNSFNVFEGLKWSE